MSKRWPRVLGHRGASGHEPENSLAAFREAFRLGATGVELDVHVSASGHLIVHHDPVIPGVGPIAELGLGEIRRARLANGEPIPRLEEALGTLLETSGRTAEAELWIELKSLPHSADRALFRAIDGCPLPAACAVHSFDHRIIARIREERPGLRRGILSASYPVDPLGQMQAAGADTLWQEWHLIDAELVGAVQAAGGEVIAWTVNDSTTARRLAGLGVNGLCGNWPERLMGSDI